MMMMRFLFVAFFLLMAGHNSALAEDWYSYTKITCRPDLEYLQIDAVTEDISPDAWNMPSRYFIAGKNITIQHGYLHANWENLGRNRYLTNSELENLIKQSGAVPMEAKYTEDSATILHEQYGLELRPVMTREERINYLIKTYHKGLKEPYQCKFKDKTVTVKEKVYPEKKICGKPTVSLLIYKGANLLEGNNYFLNSCANKRGITYIYNNLGSLTTCNGDSKGCSFLSLKEMYHKK